MKYNVSKDATVKEGKSPVKEEKKTAFSRGTVKCYNCQDVGHLARDCKKKGACATHAEKLDIWHGTVARPRRRRKQNERRE